MYRASNNNNDEDEAMEDDDAVLHQEDVAQGSEEGDGDDLLEDMEK